ncbi:hypothetical protein [Kitasatospora sp. MAP5-34]|uniref:hypothetical protein n=1 Tax=Kitasatospora sp. MAP5-34 TaxID=3035102 RepID=UPI0024734306|nr:hypothetical protein [Kitasatospora sp. MAP5-34]
MVGRNGYRGTQAVDRINAMNPAHPARFLPADLGSLDQVCALADRITAEHAASGESLTVLVNSVGADPTPRAFEEKLADAVKREPVRPRGRQSGMRRTVRLLAITLLVCLVSSGCSGSTPPVHLTCRRRQT